MPKPFASARISEELNAAIGKRSAKTGESRSDVIINALRAYLEADAEVPLSPDQRFEALEARVADLEEQLNQPAQTALFDNNNDNNSDNQAEVKQTVIKSDNSFDLDKQEWTTKELNSIGIKSSTIDNRYKRGGLPYSKNGFTVHERLRKEKMGSRDMIIWRVTRNS